MHLNWKRILLVGSDIVLGAYIVVAMAAFDKPASENTACSQVDINIQDETVNGFISPKEIEPPHQSQSLPAQEDLEGHQYTGDRRDAQAKSVHPERTMLQDTGRARMDIAHPAYAYRTSWLRTATTITWMMTIVSCQTPIIRATSSSLRGPSTDGMHATISPISLMPSWPTTSGRTR